MIIIIVIVIIIITITYFIGCQSCCAQVTAVDTNGAGDTFATAYMIALAARDSNPGQKASWAASRAVQQPQSCKPHCVTEAIQRELWPARYTILLFGCLKFALCFVMSIVNCGA